MADNPKVFVFAPADATGDSHDKLEKAGCELTLGEASWHTPQGDSEDEVCRMGQGAAAMMGTSIRSSPISRKVMEASDDLRIVAKCTVGVDDVDVDAATEMGILVCHAPTEANCHGVAEGAVAMMLALLKKVRERDDSMKAGDWRKPELQGMYLGRRETDGYQGLVLGIIGLGRIGSRVCELMAPWKMRIIACDPYVDKDKFVRYGAEQVDLETVCRESDILTMHVTHTRETRKMMGAELFALMKPDAVFINTSRGAVVQEDALADALADGTIAAAAIDVFDDEPLPHDSPLMKLGDKVLLSAHMVSSNVKSGGLHPGYQWATRSVITALNGEVPDNVFNKEVIPAWLERFGGKKLLFGNEPTG